MNENQNAEHVSNQEASTSQTKGTGYLRSKSPKAKKVPSLLSSKDSEKAVLSNLPIDNVEVTKKPSRSKVKNNHDDLSNNIKNIENKKMTTIIEKKETTSSTISENTTSVSKPRKRINKVTEVTEQKIEKSLPEELKQDISQTPEVQSVQNNTETSSPRVFEKPNPYKNKPNHSSIISVNNENRFDKNKNSQLKKTYHDKKKRSFQNRDEVSYKYNNQDDQGIEVIREHLPIEGALSQIRQRTGFVAANFWKELDAIQMSDKPINLEEDASKLILSTVLFNKEDIYLDLLEKYHRFLKIEDFHGPLISFCATKSSYFLDKTIFWYDKLFNNKEMLSNLLIDKLTYCSFRQENNFIWLSWLEQHATEEMFKSFWTKVFEFNNVVLTIEALHFKKLSKYLKDNIETFKTQIETSSKTYQIKQLLANPSYYVDKFNQYLDSDLGEKTKQFEMSLIEQLKDKKEVKEEKKTERKEETATEVIIKKKKTIDPSLSNSGNFPFL